MPTSDVWKLIITQGIFAVLFVILLYWVLKTSVLREDRLMCFIDKMQPTLEKLKNDMNEVKECLNLKERQL